MKYLGSVEVAVDTYVDVDIVDILDDVDRDTIEEYYKEVYGEDLEVELIGKTSFNPDVMLSILTEEYFKGCPNKFDFDELFRRVKGK